MSLLKNKRVVFACLCGAIAFLADTQLEPIFSTRLADFEMTTFEVGLTFTIIPATYIPSMFLVQLIPRRIEKRVILIIAAVLLGISTFLNGPSQMLGLPSKLYLIFTG